MTGAAGTAMILDAEAVVVRVRQRSGDRLLVGGTYGLHRDGADRSVDPLVLRTSNELPYASLVGLMDASSSVRRPLGPRAHGDMAAFDVTFAVD